MVHETTLMRHRKRKPTSATQLTRQTATLAQEAAVGRLIMHPQSRYDDTSCYWRNAAIFPVTELLTIFLFLPV
ncbi:hypothetical protein KCP74_13730 [Salmonella enterica subsp. enterica]|nr:hypothetical protein KCP74_13730 [Salmonella enterica subsp. enterica]